MSIDIKEIEKIAKLARLDLKEDKKQQYAEQLSDILAYADQLKEVDTKDAEPYFQAEQKESKFREDIIDQFKNQKQIIDNAPESEDNLIKVKSVL